MPAERLVAALDCGTSSTKAIALNCAGKVVAESSAPLAIYTPRPGWVEHDPHEVIKSATAALDDLLEQVSSKSVVALGVSNQRESLVLWDRESGEPLSPLLSWQDRRTRSIARTLLDRGYGETVRRISGLPLDPMFSAVKATWLLNTYDPKRARARNGALVMGTVDSWIAWNLTGVCTTDIGNASRMSLLDIETGQWSAELLDIFDVPRECLPFIGPSMRSDVAITNGQLAGRPLGALVGDSHAALFSHKGWKPGTTKVTVGTGSSVMTTAPDVVGDSGLCRTISWQLTDDRPSLALEANILAAGATLSWLAGLLNLTPAALADEAKSSTNVVFVPAFDGLGAPYWDDAAVATVSGLSLSTERADLARAALDSVAMQIADVFEALNEAGVAMTETLVDGGMARNTSLVSAIANASGASVLVADAAHASAVGAADLAGLSVGLWTMNDLNRRHSTYRRVEPEQSADVRQDKRAKWKTAVQRSREYGYDRRGK